MRLRERCRQNPGDCGTMFQLRLWSGGTCDISIEASVVDVDPTDVSRVSPSPHKSVLVEAHSSTCHFSPGDVEEATKILAVGGKVSSVNILTAVWEWMLKEDARSESPEEVCFKIVVKPLAERLRFEIPNGVVLPEGAHANFFVMVNAEMWPWGGPMIASPAAIPVPRFIPTSVAQVISTTPIAVAP